MSVLPSTGSHGGTYVELRKETDCARCEERQRVIDAIKVDVANLQADVIAKNREIGRLKAEVAKTHDEEPDADQVRLLIHLWRDVCKGGDKKVSTRTDGPRGTRVRWALKRYSVERLEHAIRGCALDDWAMGRIAKTRGKQFNDIAKHILKDEETVERYERMWLLRAQPAEPKAKLLPGRLEFQGWLDALDAVKPSANGNYSARCPAHEDRNPSLTIKLGKKGVVAECRVGCSPQDIADAIQIPLREWFFDAYEMDAPQATPIRKVVDPLPTPTQLEAWHRRLTGNRKLLERLAVVKGWTPGALVAARVGWDGERLVLPIYDAADELVTVVRYVPGGKPKSLGLKGRDRSLFPAPETLPDATLWLVEGEPDAITGLSLGLSAVGVPGSNGWRDGWAERFKGRSVVVCFDCDAPGRNAAVKVASSLLPHVLEVRALDLDPKREDGFDLSDFAVGGGTADQLQTLAAEAGAVSALRGAA